MIEHTLERIATALEQLAGFMTAFAPGPDGAPRVIPAALPATAPEPQAPAAPAAQAPAPAEAAPEAPTLESVRARFIELSKAGHRERLLELLAEHGAKTLPDLPAERLPALNTALDALGVAA